MPMSVTWPPLLWHSGATSLGTRTQGARSTGEQLASFSPGLSGRAWLDEITGLLSYSDHTLLSHSPLSYVDLLTQNQLAFPLRWLTEKTFPLRTDRKRTIEMWHLLETKHLCKAAAHGVNGEGGMKENAGVSLYGRMSMSTEKYPSARNASFIPYPKILNRSSLPLHCHHPHVTIISHFDHSYILLPCFPALNHFMDSSSFRIWIILYH